MAAGDTDGRRLSGELERALHDVGLRRFVAVALEQRHPVQEFEDESFTVMVIPVGAPSALKLAGIMATMIHKLQSHWKRRGDRERFEPFRFGVRHGPWGR